MVDCGEVVGFELCKPCESLDKLDDREVEDGSAWEFIGG